MKESEIGQMTSPPWEGTNAPGARSCIIDDCDRKHYARGFCYTHYSRVRYQTDPVYAERRRRMNRQTYRRRVERNSAS